MKTFLISVILLLAINSYTTAQNLIAVQNGSTVKFYTALDSAYVHASDGDTLYLPGGSYDAITINKRLHLVGVGHNPDSTSATSFTLINDTIVLKQGASNGSLTGIYLNGDIKINDSVYNYSIERCNVRGIFIETAFAHNNSFIENVVRGDVSGGGSSNNIFINNIFNQDYAYYPFENFNTGTVFNNNIIFRPVSPNMFSIYGTTFENNIFIGGGVFYPTNCVFSNNIVDSASSLGSTVNGNIYNSNLFYQGVNSIFVKYSAGDGFQYTDDYHLKSTSPGKNAGKDGTDIGIYGGTFPWKAGSVPFNPHIISSTISKKTNSDGTLHVRIKVAAQDH